MNKPGGGKGGGASSRVKIPDSVRSTIRSIREITGKLHSDEDIYSVLRDCSMDPNDTAQKLLYLDTFHEVKSKRDKKKLVNQISGTFNRGSRSGRGYNSAKHVNADAGGRNALHQRENGSHQKIERGPSISSAVKERVKSDAVAPDTKASAVSHNGPSILINGSSESGPHPPAGKTANFIHDKPDEVDVQKLSSLSLLPSIPSSTPDKILESAVQAQQGILGSPAPASSSGVYSSASDPVLLPSIARNPGAIGAIKREVKSRPSAAGKSHMVENKHIPPSVENETELPKNEKTAGTVIHTVNEKTASGELKPLDMNDATGTAKHSTPTQNSLLANLPASAVDDSPRANKLDASIKAVDSSEDAQTGKMSSLLREKIIANGHVIFPDHFKVPEAIKSGLTFGSFDSDSGHATEYRDDNCREVNSSHAVESSHGNGELAREPSSSISSTVEDHPDQPESAPVLDKVPESESTPAPDSKFDKLAQETAFVSEGHQNPTVQMAPNYGHGIMPPMQAGHFMQFDGNEIQAQDVSRLAGFVNENQTTSTSPSPSPSPTPPGQNIAPSQPILFRPPFPANFVPYGHYYNPYFLPPMHQFLAPNGLPQLPPTGNGYLGPAAAVAGAKFPVPQFNPGTTTGNPIPIGIQSLYSSYGASPISFNPAPPVTSAGSEDLSAPQLKDSQVYATGPPTDVSAWISAPGKDVSGLHLNSLYHVGPQGQHLALTHAQPGHVLYPGIYGPVQTITAPTTVNPLLQQTQGVSAPVETVGHPASAYQQTQLAQVNWNTGY